MNKDKKKRIFYCSMIEFEQDFFPKSFSNKQVERPADSHTIGVNFAKDSFRRIHQEVAAGKLSTDR